MNHKKLAPPSPEVQYLPAIFRRIQQGDIRMPSFQRGFVWKEGQVLELLESVYRGYPIGSLLLWRVDEDVLRVEDPKNSYFPATAVHFPTHFILDGLQRLSTLYSVFHFDCASHPSMFDVHFDLETAEFIPGASSVRRKATISLRDIFSPRAFLTRQQELSELPNANTLIEDAIALHSSFQEYLIPVVSITGRSPGDVVQVFERINNTGTRLSAVDFLRAVTWSDRFDLTSEISSLRQEGTATDYDVPTETLVKVLAIVMGKHPTAESMLELRKASPKDLAAGVKKTRTILGDATTFLRDILRIFTYDLVAYEAQFLAITKFFCASPTITASRLEALARWFWKMSYTEELQGKSEHQIAQIVEVVARDPSASFPSVPVNSFALWERRFRWGSALSNGIAGLFVASAVRSLVTGTPIDAHDFMTEGGGRNFVPLLNRDELRDATGFDIPAAKSVSNIFIASASDIAAIGGRDMRSVLRSTLALPNAEETLESQFLTTYAVDALLAGNVIEFATIRAEQIGEFATRYLTTD